MKTRITKSYDGEVNIALFEDWAPDSAARLAFAFIEKWGMVASTPDGEDSTGRQKLRLLSPEELVKRAFDTAALATKEAMLRGMGVSLPDQNEINKEFDEKRERDSRARAEARNS